MSIKIPPISLVTTHFTLRELTITQFRQFANVPGPVELMNLGRLCKQVLEPMREKLGPLRITSGYRSPAVNIAAGGDENSAHMDGRAADHEPWDLSKFDEVDLMRAYADSSIPYDKCIFERRENGQWVHVQVRKIGHVPRQELWMSLKPGIFEPWDLRRL